MIVLPHTDQGAAPGQTYRWLRWLRVTGLGKGGRGHRPHPGRYICEGLGAAPLPAAFGGSRLLLMGGGM